MLLIHDLVEIDVGGTVIYASETDELKAEEVAGIRRMLSILPNGMDEETMDLWNGFDSGKTPDSKFAKAIDRVPPLLHNIQSGGHSWNQHDITKELVFALNQRIEKGSKELWPFIRNKLEDVVNGGIPR
jgi:putative hydrolase of HD superfamily